MADVPYFCLVLATRLVPINIVLRAYFVDALTRLIPLARHLGLRIRHSLFASPRVSESSSV